MHKFATDRLRLCVGIFSLWIDKVQDDRTNGQMLAHCSSGLQRQLVCNCLPWQCAHLQVVCDVILLDQMMCPKLVIHDRQPNPHRRIEYRHCPMIHMKEVAMILTVEMYSILVYHGTPRASLSRWNGN